MQHLKENGTSGFPVLHAAGSPRRRDVRWGPGRLMRPSHAIPCKMLIVTWLVSASLIGSTMCRLNVRPPRIHIVQSRLSKIAALRESFTTSIYYFNLFKGSNQFFHNLSYRLLFKISFFCIYYFYSIDWSMKWTLRINEIPKLVSQWLHFNINRVIKKFD